MPKQRVHTSPQYRILVVGDSAVGKTSLIARYVRNEFPCHTRSHINSDGSTVYPTAIDGHECVLTFIDVPSSTDILQLKISRSIPTACFIVFSICDQRSFEKIDYFQESINLLSSSQSIFIPIFLIANKNDFEEDRVVTNQSKLNGDPIFETSAKTSQGIHDVIHTAVKYLRNNFVQKRKSKHSSSCLIL